MSGDIHPWVTEGLLYYGLITEEQAAVAYARYDEEWKKAWDDSNWWHSLAEIAWHNEASWWEKVKCMGMPMVWWKIDWIKERRGW